MSTLELKGINGADPLGFLAAMGAFRVATIKDPSAKMKWNSDRATPYPALETALSSDDLDNAIREVGKALLAESQSSRAFQDKIKKQRSQCKCRREALKNKQKELAKSEKEANKRRSKEDKKSKTDINAAIESETRKERAALVAAEQELLGIQEQYVKDMPDGSVRYGTIIGVAKSVYRSFARDRLERCNCVGDGDRNIPIAMLASFASDAVCDDKGEVSPSLLSFTNNPSSKQLLADMSKSASRIGKSDFSKFVLQADVSLGRDREVPESRWSPGEFHSYALQARNPESATMGACAIQNIMAFIGMSCFPSMPGKGGGLATVGFGKKKEAGIPFRWAVWNCSVGLQTAISIEEALVYDKTNSARQRGVYMIYESPRFSTEQGNIYFGIAGPV